MFICEIFMVILFDAAMFILILRLHIVWKKKT